MISRRVLAGLPFLVLLHPVLAAAEDKNKQKGTYIAIDALAATVLHSSGRRGVMTVEAGIDVPDPKFRAYADDLQPRLRDAYAQVLQSYAGRLEAETPPDADYLARQLQGATDRVLGHSGARLLLGGVMIN